MGLFTGILFASDFDRTLTDTVSRVPQRNIDAVRYFIREGGRFSVATGRSIPMFRQYLDRVPVNAPYILYNGAACWDAATGELSDLVPIPGGDALLRELLGLLPDMCIEIQGIEYHHLFGENSMRDEFFRHNRCAIEHTDPARLPTPILKIAMYSGFYDTTVAHLYSGSPEDIARMDRADALLRERYSDRVVVDRAALRIIDLQERSVSKGSAARRLADRLGCDTLVCAGDAFNDLSMLEEADIAFVPSDCDRSVAGRGFCEMCSCDAGTVADAVEFLEKLRKSGK